ncbi:hypothetical protein QQX98_006387 [Neonectria punicea]|uniref:F-box domain-containing protein n=1 Tax=Neonectria punicea TaxID=979145 RepID=A0ABR1H110_9HYPO
MDPCGLPLDILYEIARHLPFSSVANWVLTNRRHYEVINQVLYMKLPRKASRVTKLRHDNTAEPRFRGLVLAWAASCGNVATVKNILALEKMGSWINEPVLGRGCSGGLRPPGSYGMTPMHQAARRGHIEIIDLLANFGADVDATVAEDVLRPIHFARSADVVKALVRHGSSIDPLCGSRAPLTYQISSSRRLDVVKCLVDLGCNIDAVTPDATSAAHEATRLGMLSVLNWLFDAGLDVTHPTPPGGSLIYHAIYHLKAKSPGLALKFVSTLLEHGAPAHGGKMQVNGPHARETFQTNLYLAITIPHAQTLSDLLIAHGAELETKCWMRDDAGGSFTKTFFTSESEREPVTPVTHLLLNASISPELHAEDKLRTVSIFLKHGAKIDTGFQGSSLLNYFLNRSRGRSVLKVVHFMLDHGADMNSPFELGWVTRRPIHIFLTNPAWLNRSHRVSPKAASSVLERLLQRGTDPNMPDSGGTTPLTSACCMPVDGYARETIKLLLQYGAKVETPTIDGLNMLHCILGGYSRLFPESADRFHVLLNRAPAASIGIDALDKDGMTPLARLASLILDKASKAEAASDHALLRKRMMIMLIRSGANVHAKQIGNTQKPFLAGATPLHFACYNWDPVALELLLDKGACEDVNLLTDAGFTPLMILVTAAIEKVVKRNEVMLMKQLLLDAGADPTVRNAEGKTAWDLWTERETSGKDWAWEPVMKDLEVRRNPP